MSVQAFAWVLEHSESRLGPRHVMISIANHCDRCGQNAFPSKRTIAHEARLSPREVQYAIGILVESGELAVEYGTGPGGTNSYSLPLMGGANFARGGAQTGAQNPTCNKERTKATVNQIPPLPPLSGGKFVLTDRQRSNLAKEVQNIRRDIDSRAGARVGNPEYVTFADVLREACANLLLPFDQVQEELAADALWAERLGMEKKEPGRAIG